MLVAEGGFRRVGVGGSICFVETHQNYNRYKGIRTLQPIYQHWIAYFASVFVIDAALMLSITGHLPEREQMRYKVAWCNARNVLVESRLSEGGT